MSSSAEQLADDTTVHIGVTGTERYHADQYGLPACPQLIQQLAEEERDTVTVREAERRGKTPCQRCFGDAR